MGNFAEAKFAGQINLVIWHIRFGQFNARDVNTVLKLGGVTTRSLHLNPNGACAAAKRAVAFPVKGMSSAMSYCALQECIADFNVVALEATVAESNNSLSLQQNGKDEQSNRVVVKMAREQLAWKNASGVMRF
ncbi:uncharacterized protein PHALS_14224 [Plasmopara halstedii]|uniref:Uncharacterized protein n=1 Tax=Plasmopara halstedii TaxID=4781 RepID=A0A0P1ARF0_PLAHL|nr:uncharacterized protein PHALS_14224 [Plasmopara halstedii]CEG43945.1 hypothetical protein PHALS_14224 [Plasmopara halstedii]|eukprot:XP_024580314.1 hypothetical protein PHALS_14224 [Plasmopara halstedii]